MDYKIIVNRDFYLVAVLLFLQIKLTTFLCKSLQSISKYPQFQYSFFSIEVLVKTSYSCFLCHSFRERGKEIRNETKTHHPEHTNTLSILLLCWNRKQNLAILAPNQSICSCRCHFKKRMGIVLASAIFPYPKQENPLFLMWEQSPEL